MFGGIGFLLDGNLVAGASKRGLLLRLGKERYAEALLVVRRDQLISFLKSECAVEAIAYPTVAPFIVVVVCIHDTSSFRYTRCRYAERNQPIRT
jgi:hypothetical protein